MDPQPYEATTAPGPSRSTAARLARAVRAPIESWLTGSSLIGRGPFHDPDAFPWISGLERHWREIRAELDALLDLQLDLPRSQDLVAASRHRDDGWKTILLQYYGMESPRVCAQCPRTVTLLRSVAGLRAASFSLLYPGQVIPPHRGPFAGVIRYHLGLRIPAPTDGCGLRVGDEVRHWDEGASLLFDESYQHEAWNHTDGLRVVLFLDIVRPLRQPARSVNALALKAFAASPYARSTKRKAAAWEQTSGLPVP